MRKILSIFWRSILVGFAYTFTYMAFRKSIPEPSNDVFYQLEIEEEVL